MPIFLRAGTGRFGLLLGGLWLALALARAGAAGDYLVDVWTSENGLPDSSVTAIAQTPDGYLWVGTYNGLARFDGVRFVTFDPDTTPELGHARVRKLYVDVRGTLWITTYDGSLATYAGGKFTLEQRTIRLSDGEFIFSSANQVLFLSGRGDLFRKTLTAPAGQGWEIIPPPGHDLGIGATAGVDRDGTLWYCDSEKRVWRLTGRQYERLPAAAGLAGQRVNCLATDAGGQLWAGTEQGLYRWRQNRFDQVLPASPGMSPGVTFLAPAADGRIWAVVNGAIGAVQDGKWAVSPEGGKKFFPGNSGRLGAQADHVGGAWFYSYGRGLLHVAGDGQVRPLTEDDGFPGERVYGVFEDREGNCWAGLDDGGLVRVRVRQFHRIGTGENKYNPAAKSVAEDPSGVLWIGMLSGGLGRWEAGQYASRNVAAGGGSVFCVCPDAAGRLWLSAGDEDLYIQAAGEIWRRLPVVHGVKAIFRDRAGHVWVGTTSSLLCSETGEPGDLKAFAGIPRCNIRALAEDRSGRIWAGTGSGEIYEIAGQRASLFRPEDKQAVGAIWSLLADDDGTVWAGTFRGGLLRLKDGHFTRFSKSDGLPDNVICQILDDARGNLWLGSHQGVFRVAKADLAGYSSGRLKFIPCIDYARSDGLPSLECSGGYQPAAGRTRAGLLWFTTVKGATWIQPDEIRPNATPPPVVIEEIMVDGQMQKPAGPLENRRLEIAPGKHQIAFHYTGLSLTSPERVQFRYRLSGVDADWVRAGTWRSAQYNLLPPGEYRFGVTAGNSDGVWNSTGAEMDISIRPYFYETRWFQVGVVLLVLGGVAGFVRQVATRRLRLAMEELERKRMLERERTRIAKDIHDDLGASLTLIAVLGDLAKKERVQERIEKMSATAREAVKSLDEIVWAVNPRNDTLAHLIDYTGQFAVNYLRDAGIRCLLDVPDHLPAREVPTNVRHNVFLTVKEALQNIVKHAHATEVWLRISMAGQRLQIKVEDNGCGFNGAPADAWADGLPNMRQRLAEVGGECRIQSEPGQGTAIAIELPLPPD